MASPISRQSDYVTTLASVLEGLRRKEESDEVGKRTEELLERACKEAEAE